MPEDEREPTMGEFSDSDPDGELLYRQWQILRERLENALGPRSELAGTLAAYAAEWAGAVRLDEVRALRDQHGNEADMTAEELWPLLHLHDD